MTQPEHLSGGQHRAWPVRIFRLGEEPGDDLSSESTPEQRLAMVTELSRRMWELSGRPVPSYSRAAIPGRVLNLADLEALGELPPSS